MSHIVITDNVIRNFHGIIEIDPFDEKMTILLKDYDKSHKTNYYKLLLDITNSSNSSNYQLLKMTNPLNKGIFCSYDGIDIFNVCLAEYETDLKKFRIYIDENNFSICDDITKYAFRNLDMEEVIVFVNIKNKTIINKLIANDYIPLSNDVDKEKSVILIKEKDHVYFADKNVICV